MLILPLWQNTVLLSPLSGTPRDGEKAETESAHAAILLCWSTFHSCARTSQRDCIKRVQAFHGHCWCRKFLSAASHMSVPFSWGLKRCFGGQQQSLNAYKLRHQVKEPLSSVYFGA